MSTTVELYLSAFVLWFLGLLFRVQSENGLGDFNYN